MNAHGFIATLPVGPGQDPREIRFFAQIILRHLAKHLPDLRRADGKPPEGIWEHTMLVRELVAAAQDPQYSAPLRSPMTLRQEQQRWKEDPVCAVCKHVHEGKEHCLHYLGEEKFCQCEEKNA